jgi:hypothetical protein
MDCSIIDVAPERARSAAKRHISSVRGAHRTTRGFAARRWLTARDDLNTYRLCGVLFLIGTILGVSDMTVIELVMEVTCARI